MLNLDAPYNERIRDQGAMAAPGYSLCAHQRAFFLLCKINQSLQVVLELLRLHVIRKAPEGVILPAFVL